jgi:hypothetical protein
MQFRMHLQDGKTVILVQICIFCFQSVFIGLMSPVIIVVMWVIRCSLRVCAPYRIISYDPSCTVNTPEAWHFVAGYVELSVRIVKLNDMNSESEKYCR